MTTTPCRPDLPPRAAPATPAHDRRPRPAHDASAVRVGRALAAALGLALALAWAVPAQAQPHQTTQGAYTLRSSVVASTELPSSTAQRHGIKRSARRAVLNVLVEHVDGAARRPVRAAVKARVRNPAGGWRKIPVRAVEAGGRVSYVGDFRHGPRETLEFEVNARPDGSDAWLRVRFRQRMRPG